jgi:hypothetical protein
MQRVYDAVDKYNRILIFSPHSVGKTHGLSGLVTKLLTCHPATSIITTAPTHRQVEDLLWKEIAARYNSMPPEWQLGKLSKTKWEIERPDQKFKWFAKGFSVQKSATTDRGQGKNSALQGYHNDFRVVAILDECVGVEPLVWGMTDGIISNARDKLIGIGNPTTRNCEAFRRSKLLNYHVIFITCFETPNFIANGITCLGDMIKERDIIMSLDQDEALEHLNSYTIVNHHLITVQWGIEMLLAKGETHPDFQSKVIGQFPDEDSSVLIPEHVVRKALSESYNIEDDDVRYIGVDVAREGNDSTVFTEIVGWQHTRTKVIDGNDTLQVVKGLIDFMLESDHHKLDDGWPDLRETRIAIDPGYNPGVYDALRAIIDPWTYQEQAELVQSVIDKYGDEFDQTIIFDVPFGSTQFDRFYFGWADDFEMHEKSYEEDRALQLDKAHYQNLKAKMFDQLASDLKGYWKGKLSTKDDGNERQQGQLYLNPEYDEMYTEQLPTILMVHSKNDSKMMIESKKDYKERTGQGSPDEADSLALANLARYFMKPVEGF